MRGFRPSPRLTVAVLAVLVAVVLATVWRFPPRIGSFYPPCLTKQLTGLFCPGCGTGRALHDLLHLRAGEAFAHNPLLVILLPLLAGWGGFVAWQALRHDRWREPQLPGWSVKLLAITFVCYFVARNLPWEPFVRLRP